jgi:hypothetical protein
MPVLPVPLLADLPDSNLDLICDAVIEIWKADSYFTTVLANPHLTATVNPTAPGLGIYNFPLTWLTTEQEPDAVHPLNIALACCHPGRKDGTENNFLTEMGPIILIQAMVRLQERHMAMRVCSKLLDRAYDILWGPPNNPNPSLRNPGRPGTQGTVSKFRYLRSYLIGSSPAEEAGKLYRSTTMQTEVAVHYSLEYGA